jgi:Ni/Co efflux regulator RcnB
MTPIHKKLLAALAALAAAAAPVAIATAKGKPHHAKKSHTATKRQTDSSSSTEDPAESSGAAYEVHITKSDGSRAEVLEDSSFTVLSTTADDHGPRGPHPGGDNS